MPGNAAVKSTARVALKRFWPKAVGVSAILLAVLFLLVYVCATLSLFLGGAAQYVNLAVTVVYAIFLFFPFALGVLRFFWRATAGINDPMTSLFCYFASHLCYRKALLFSLSLCMRLVGAALACYFPCILISVCEMLPLSFLTEQFFMQLDVIRNALFVLGSVFFVISTVRFYIAPMIFVSCEGLHWEEAVFISKNISRYTSGQFFVLCIGFVGWAILSLSGVLLLYTLPFFLSAYAVHCRYAFNHYNHNVKLLKDTDFPAYRSTF